MEKFNHLFIVMALIIGLTVNDLLLGCMPLLKSASCTLGYMVVTVWAIVILFALLQYWWIMWTWSGSNQGLGMSRFGFFLLLVLFPIAMHFASAVAFPDELKNKAADELCKTFLMKQNTFFGCCGAAMVFLFVSNCVWMERVQLDSNNITCLVFAVIFGFGALRRVQLDLLGPDTFLVVVTAFVSLYMVVSVVSLVPPLRDK